MTRRMSALEREVYYPESDGQPVAETDYHIDQLLYARGVLKVFFAERPNVYAAGNMLLYYEEGYPEMSVAPDVFVVFGVEKRKRRTYKLWEEGKAPDWVLEVTSRSSQKEDQVVKRKLYARLGVKEYFLSDPVSDYLRPPLQGNRLRAGRYEAIPLRKLPGGWLAVKSAVLGLDVRLHPASSELRFYDPREGRILPTLDEALADRHEAEERAQQETAARHEAQERARRAEQELRRLRGKLTRSRRT
jgi:Uma2 family endonuclease